MNLSAGSGRSGKDLTHDPKVWFVCPRPESRASLRLFCFPYAGGGPSIFTGWPSGLPADLEVWAAHLPGRGSRYHESAYRQLIALVEAYSSVMRPLLDRPFALFGHSLGALLAFELARQLQEEDFPQPATLFVSARSAPHLPDPHPVMHALAEGDLLKSLQQLNGIPREVLLQPEVIRLLLPTLRADLEALETYHYETGPALKCPIVVFAGANDARNSHAGLEGWAGHTSSTFKLRYFPGDHFFINTTREAVLAAIGAELVKSPGQ